MSFQSYRELNNYISKDKIKAKIEEYKKEADKIADMMIKAIENEDDVKFNIFNNASNILAIKIGVLQELLEEE